MKNNMKFFLIGFISAFTCLFLTGMSCGETFYSIKIKNDSPNDVIACGAHVLPDSLLPPTPLSTIIIKAQMINALHDFHVEDRGLKRFENEKISIFIIDKQVYESEPWDSIRKYNKILKRYEFNFDDYKRMGSVVSYP